MPDHHETPDSIGWYDDPRGTKGMERYWNGSEWSGAPRKKPPQLNWGGVATIVVGTIVLAALAWWWMLG